MSLNRTSGRRQPSPAGRRPGPGALLIGALLLAAVSPARGSAPAHSLFEEAAGAYAAGAYEPAAMDLRRLAEQSPSAGVYHNLGNAEWGLGRTGEAILAWERACWISPFSANTRANLRYARHKAQLPSPALGWHEICSTWLPVDAWAALASASFWLALAMVLLPGILRWRKADWHQAAAAGFMAVFLLTLPALWGVGSRAQLGVVLAKSTPLRLTPTSEAQVLTRLPAGEVARLERQLKDYCYIRTGNDASGWVKRGEFGLIAAP